MTTQDLHSTEYVPYYENYIAKVSSSTELVAGFVEGKKKFIQFLTDIPSEKLEYRYAPGKWTIKQVIQHLIDSERIFIYRCFRIARGDKADLAGFDQNDYIEPSRANSKSLEDLISEYNLSRQHSISIIKSLTEEDLCQIGSANGGPMSARSAAFITLGHENWHKDIIQERYLS